VLRAMIPLPQAQEGAPPEMKGAAE
jgi:hypothetical protein